LKIRNKGLWPPAFDTLLVMTDSDVIGWVALVDVSSGLTALLVLLTGAGYAIFLLEYRWLAKRTGSLEQGTQAR
jgi:hypothetical protein